MTTSPFTVIIIMIITYQIAIPRNNMVTIRVLFIPEISSLEDMQKIYRQTTPTASIPQPSSSSSSSSQQQRKSSMSSSSSLFNRIKAITQPIPIDIKIDRLASIQTLRDTLKLKIPPMYLQHSRNEIILIESQPIHWHTVTKFLRNTHTISNLLDDTIVFAYCPSSVHQHHLLLLQRSIQPIFPTEDDNNLNDEDDDDDDVEEEDEAKADEDDDNHNDDDTNNNNHQKDNSYQKIRIMDEWQKLLNFNLTGKHHYYPHYYPHYYYYCYHHKYHNYHHHHNHHYYKGLGFC